MIWVSGEHEIEARFRQVSGVHAALVRLPCDAGAQSVRFSLFSLKGVCGSQHIIKGDTQDCETCHENIFQLQPHFLKNKTLIYKRVKYIIGANLSFII